jgi:hypothetical protein
MKRGIFIGPKQLVTGIVLVSLFGGRIWKVPLLPIWYVRGP